VAIKNPEMGLMLENQGKIVRQPQDLN